MAKTYTTVPSKISGETFTLTNWSTHVRDNINNLIVPPSVRAYRSTTQSITNSAFNSISFDGDRWDSDSMWSNASPTRITINTTGVYLVGCSVYWATNSTGIRTLRIMVNATTAIGYNEINAGVSAGPGQVINSIYNFTAGDYITFDVFQTSGGSLDLASGSAYSPEGWAAWLGKAS